MKDDIYHNYKEHKIKQETLCETATKLEITDPRPPGAGDIFHFKWTRHNPFPPQEGTCLCCGRPLNKEMNPGYLAEVIGYCDKFCRKNHEKQLIDSGQLVVHDPNPIKHIQSGEANTNWAKGWWENIAPEPIYIENKQHLKEVCEKHGVMAKALLKHNSQEKGMEMR